VSPDALTIIQIATGILMSLVLFVLRTQTKNIDKLRGDINGVSAKVSREVKDVREEAREEIKDLRKEMKEKDDDLQSSIMGIHRMLPRSYVLKEDYIRVMASVDSKLDNLGNQLGQLTKDVHEVIGKESGNE